MMVSYAQMLGLRPRCLAEISDFFQNIGRYPQLILVYFLSLRSTYRQSFAFPSKSELKNALLRSRSGCLQIQTLSSTTLLPVMLNTVYDKSLLILYCSQHPCKRIQWPPGRTRLRGIWVAQSVERVTLAQVMISLFVSSSPASGSVLTAQSLEPTSYSVSLPLCLSPAHTLSLSQK